jgi:glycosyltransferase involved in cell wall biosynthesis
VRIGVLVDRLEVGGVEKVAIQQVASLRELGHDAELVLLRRRGEGLSLFAAELDEIPVRVLEDRLPSVLRGSVRIPGFSFLQAFHFTYPLFARRLVRAREFDVLLAHGTYTCITGLAVRRARSIPLAAFVWDPTYHVLSGAAYSDRFVGKVLPVLLPLACRFDSWLARRADLIVLGGTEFRAYLEGRGATRILVSYPAATPVEKPLPANRRAPEMLAVTAWKHGKNPERLLPLLERADGLKLVLCGEWLDPEVRAQFESVVAALRLEGRVELTGGLAERELGDRYARARFAIQTWPSPGFGLSPLEAAARGTTFVAPLGQGSSEIFRDGVDGFLFDPRGDGALAAAVDRLVADPALALEMGTNAWRHVHDDHTWSARAAELAAALASLD